MDYLKFYRGLYQTFGYPLVARAGIAQSRLSRAEKRQGVAIPAALRDYYLAAGLEKRFNCCFQQLLSPEDWRVDQRRLIFMEENQGVVLWGCSVGKTTADPVAWQAVAGDELTWYQEHRRCSSFLAVMLHYQAVCGGMDHTGWAPLPSPTMALLRDWKCYGTICGTTAFSRQNQVVCVSESLHAAGKTAADLREIEGELQVTFQ